MLRALLRFHFRVGVRVAIRASPPLFCAIVAGVVFPIAAIAFLLPAWGKARLRQSLNGWMRHLPLSDGMNGVGLWLALVTVQLPLVVMLTLLGLVAARSGLPIRWPAIRWVLVVSAG